ncbi:UNKNOWN [Stylonychia lemnae]|uniref:Uncharacterized protein n=1 Tax=Stylonychia lemnae TaxID=5949 RepID=A0A078A1T3_STYLE|nr:UNKNOWN [Stylonychia lemnae]|eukprot:CDW74744.1 UNKNOWN [Stylonychia lemnae]
MTYPGLRSPIAILFFGSILFQCISIVSITVPPIYDIGASTLEKIYMGFMFWTFFSLMREFVFFESLFQTDCAQNNPMFISQNSQDDLGLIDRQGSGFSAMNAIGTTSSQIKKYGSQFERRKQLQERLLRVPFDRALEEEKILNTVFPSQDIKKHQLPLSQQKNDALDEDILECRKVARCFDCCAYEYFERYEDAKQFRRGVVCSVVFFIVAVTTKNFAHMFLYYYNIVQVGNRGKISEFEPLKKYYWFLFLAFTIIIQKFMIHRITEASIRADDRKDRIRNHQFAMQINALLRSVELLVFLIGMIKHFQIKTDEIQQTNNSFHQDSKNISPIGLKRVSDAK